jgi:hypothetical protein
VSALCRPLPPPPLSSPAVVVPAAVAVEEFQESLLVWEDDLTRRDEALTMREAKAGIFEKALAQVSITLNVERDKVEATWQEYLDKIQAHSDRAKTSLGLDKILG